jgi:quercetin dioxygenase-like cupin family protein
LTVTHEKAACAYEADPPYTRTLKVLFAPSLQKEVDGFAAGYTILPPGGESDYTRHSEGEMFCVISGKGEMKGEKCSYPLRPGTMVWCPPWDYHQLVNSGNNRMKVLWLLLPPGREESIIKLCEKKLSREKE